MEAKEQAMRRIIESYISSYNDFDVDAMLRNVHQDVEFKNISGNEVNASTKGIGELRNLAEQSKALFTSRRQMIIAFEAEGDAAKTAIEFEAVLAVDLPNGMKAGDVLRLNGHSEFKFKDGKIYRIEDYS